jgi:hypothetical protein
MQIAGEFESALDALFAGSTQNIDDSLPAAAVEAEVAYLTAELRQEIGA